MNTSRFTSVTNYISSKNRIRVKTKKWRMFALFVLVNVAIAISINILTGGALIGLLPYEIILGCIAPFIYLLTSRWIAKKAHKMYIIDRNNIQNEDERNLYNLIESLSKKVLIDKMPQVGIYESNDINAFATGRNKNSSLVAFSTGLLRNMDDRSVAAVAAHEIAHIASGDMITMTVLQSIINIIVLCFTVPLLFIELFFLFYAREGGSRFFYWFTALTKFLLTTILMFLGSLIIKAFSRHREFKADKLASVLVDKDSMIKALESLKLIKHEVDPQQSAFAALKISSNRGWFDIFSTHPSLDRRVEAIKKLSGIS